MSHYTGSVPDTEPALTWLANAACAGLGDTMFPGDNERDKAAAKNICRPCPVWEECLRHALATGDNQHGIRGGLTPRERRTLAKQAGTAPIPLPKPKQPREPRPTSLAEAVRRRTVRIEGGHLAWTGFEHLRFQGKRYTAFQAAFIVGHGREPEGIVRRTCDEDCFRADHLTDSVIRDAQAVCGTRDGYRLHRKRGEDACAPCKRANAMSDTRPGRAGAAGRRDAVPAL